MREPIQWQKRAVDERLIEQIAHVLQEEGSVRRRELDFSMVRAAVLGDRTGEWPLIVTGLGKAETERLDRSPAPHLGGDRGNGAGIDPTTQEQPERHVTDELPADRSLELLPERPRPLVRLQRGVRRE